MPDLATVGQVAAILQTDLASNDATAAQLVRFASGAIRSYLDQQITLVTDDVELCTPLPGGFVQLRELPVVAVSLVETWSDDTGLWTVMDPSIYRVSVRDGSITAARYTWYQWPCGSETWRVTYTHGYATVPDDLSGVCASFAARLYGTPVGIDSERLGQRMTKYALDADDFSAIELKVLGHYREARIR